MKNMSSSKTKDLIESLEAESELTPEWEVVFPDCPIDSDHKSNGPFSVSGDKWINDDSTDKYTNCWPMDWLPDDYPNIRVIGCNYESSLSHWSVSSGCVCEKTAGKLESRAKEFLEYLIDAGVGHHRPVVWVGHSMGGLLAKKIIIQALESDDPNLREIAENTMGVLFLGTPHKGSQFAQLKQASRLLFSPTVEVVDLCENAKHLLQLNEKFIQFVNEFKKIEIVCIAEGLPTVMTSLKLPLNIVTKESAALNVGDFYVLNEDHLGISKPICKQSFLYQRLLKMIEKALLSSQHSS